MYARILPFPSPSDKPVVDSDTDDAPVATRFELVSLMGLPPAEVNCVLGRRHRLDAEAAADAWSRLREAARNAPPELRPGHQRKAALT